MTTSKISAINHLSTTLKEKWGELTGKLDCICEAIKAVKVGAQTGSASVERARFQHREKSGVSGGGASAVGALVDRKINKEIWKQDWATLGNGKYVTLKAGKYYIEADVCYRGVGVNRTLLITYSGEDSEEVAAAVTDRTPGSGNYWTTVKANIEINKETRLFVGSHVWSTRADGYGQASGIRIGGENKDEVYLDMIISKEVSAPSSGEATPPQEAIRYGQTPQSYKTPAMSGLRFSLPFFAAKYEDGTPSKFNGQLNVFGRTLPYMYGHGEDEGGKFVGEEGLHLTQQTRLPIGSVYSRSMTIIVRGTWNKNCNTHIIRHDCPSDLLEEMSLQITCAKVTVSMNRWNTLAEIDRVNEELIIIVDDKDFKIFVDKIRVQHLIIPKSISSVFSCHLGGKIKNLNTGAPHAQGLIREVLIFNKALSLSEIPKYQSEKIYSFERS